MVLELSNCKFYDWYYGYDEFEINFLMILIIIFHAS